MIRKMELLDGKEYQYKFFLQISGKGK